MKTNETVVSFQRIRMVQQRNRRYKAESHGKFRNKKYNKPNKIVRGGARQQAKGDRGIKKPEDRTIDVTQTEQQRENRLKSKEL